MGGKLSFVDEVKKSMGLLVTQGFSRGISSDDISKYLRSLVAQYKAAGKNVQYT